MSLFIVSKVHEWMLTTLSRRVRVCSYEQIARAWFDGDLKQATREITKLQGEGLLDVYQELVGETLPIETPLLSWEPGPGRTPDFGKLAYRSSSRWTGEPQQQKLAIASKLTVQRYMGFTNGKEPTRRALRHDLQVTELYLHFLAENSSKSRKWVGEDELQKTGYCDRKESIPDAAIRDKRNRKKDILIEIGGQYSAERLSEFHRKYQACRYELW